MLSLLNVHLVDLWQSIDIVMITFDAEILCQIDNLDILRNRVFFEKSLTLSMSEAEKHDIDVFKRHRIREFQVGLTV